MNIKEVMKKATPGPLIAHKGEIYKCDNVTAPFTHVGFCGDDGTPHYKEMSDNEQDTNQQLGEANAALLAHWYNVGPKMLEALKREHEDLLELWLENNEHEPDDCPVCKFIAEASEVKL